MPVKGKLWRHVTISTYCSWLKGDPRGFRTRDHTIHSSGDYKKRPPKGEHDGLHDYFLTRAHMEVQVGWNERKLIGQALVKWFREHRHPLLALAVTKVHTHFLVEFVDNIPEIHRIVGEAKRKSSRGEGNDAGKGLGAGRAIQAGEDARASRASLCVRAVRPRARRVDVVV